MKSYCTPGSPRLALHTIMQRLLPIAAIGLLTLLATSLHADPLAEIATYSSIPVDLNALYNGTIQVGRGTALRSSRGLSTQAVYLARRPLAFTQKFLVSWDPSAHPEMDTYQSFNFHSEADAKFEEFKFTRTDRPTKMLMEYTLKIRNHSDDLHLTKAEVESLKATMAALPDKQFESPAFQSAASAFWTSVLKSRFDLYKKGGVSALPPIEMDGNRFSVSEELRSMFSDSPAITKRFLNLLDTTCLRPTPGEPIASALYYWQLFKADSIATVCLGGIYTSESPENSKMLDLQFYVSNSYFTSVTLYDLFPVKVNGEDCTLIWRADYVSAPALMSVRGVEQMAAGMLMSQSIKQAVQFFIADINKAPVQ